jgi:oxygen-independent coproporphyrinogen-3 oxidase
METQPTSDDPLSLYFHVPFCESLCFYCGCTKEIRKRQDATTTERVQRLIHGLKKEIQIKAAKLQNPKVGHIHFGGGTPTFLTREEWSSITKAIHEHFTIDDDCEWALEVDPRSVTPEDLGFLRQLGFRRLSLGVQDFAEKVQKAVNRIQSFESVQTIVDTARDLGFTSINFDLIYGLPFQTLESMDQTLTQVITLNPDRIAFYRLAVIPQIFKWQKSFLQKDLPEGKDSLALQLKAIERFTTAGYQFIGLDHFAKPDDTLAHALRHKHLTRNFQGMTSGRDRLILGFGPSAISAWPNTYFQNPRTLDQWSSLYTINYGSVKSCTLSLDDVIRRQLISDIYCYGDVSLESLGQEYHFRYLEYFHADLLRLETLLRDGLAQYSAGQVTEQGLLGRLLRRVIASSFDAYLPPDIFKTGLPRDKASQVG